MSANKCKYSIKMIPLVVSLKRASSNREEFEQKINQFFTFSDTPEEDLQQLKEFVERASTSDNLVAGTASFDEIEQQKLGEAKVVSYDGTARAAYSDDDAGYNSMKHAFISNMVERVIYDPNTNTWFDIDKVVEENGNFTYLDMAIFKYKKELIDIIRNGLKLPPVTLDITSSTIDQDLTQLINDTVIAYQNRTFGQTENEKLDAVKQAYVILFNFDNLLQEHTPFIGMKDFYRRNNVQGISMYSYSGPHANLRTGWSQEDKIVSAKEQYSGLAKTLLSYFQEYDNGFIPDTSIGVDGFISVMKRMRNALIYSNNGDLQEAKAEYYKGDAMDMAYVIKTYLDVVQSKGLDRDFSTTLNYKLKGILHSIYLNDKIPQDIKSMFTRMFFETIPLKYRTLGTFNGEFKASNLEDNWIRNQNYNLQESINGKVLSFRENPNAWDVIQTMYNIGLESDSNATSGVIDFSFKEGDRPVELRLKYSYLAGRSGRHRWNFEFEQGADFDGKMAERLIYDLTGYLITPEYRSYTRNLNGGTALNDFAGAIGISVLGSLQGNIQPFRSNGILDTTDGVVLFHKGLLFAQLEAPSKIASLVAGSETANTVKDVNGNNLPTNGLTSLAYETDEFITHHKNKGTFRTSLIAMNPGLMTAPLIQEGITVNGKGKKNRSLNVRELYEFGIVFNFLNELQNGVIYPQPTVNADKSKVLSPGFNIGGNLLFDPSGIQYNLKDLLESVAKGQGDLSARASLDHALMTLRHNRYATIAEDLLDKYNAVLGTDFADLKAVDDYLVENNIKYDALRAMFRAEGVRKEFIEDHTATKGANGVARINETLLNKVNTFNGDTSKDSRFQKRMDRSKRRFAYDLISDGFRLNPYTSKGGLIAFRYLQSFSGSKWYDETSRNIIFAKLVKDGKEVVVTKENADLLLDPKIIKVTINPILESYFYANAILDDEYNAASIGEDYSHANKNKSGDPNRTDFDETEWEEFSEASRWVSSVKRNVIPGASLHPLLQFKWDGVAESIKVAAMSDISAATFSIFGVKKDDNDSMDGCGIGNIWEILLEKNSLVDAAPSGYDLKTIGWDLDENGIPMMLKWAVYGITNERRRKGYLSKTNVESLYKRMNDIVFNKYIAVNEYFQKYSPNGFFINNPETGGRLHVESVVGINRTLEDGSNKIVFYRVATNESNERVFLDKRGNVYADYNEIKTEDLDLNTIYDLDTFFGGAWAETYENGRYKSWDLNYQAVLDIICSENLKDNFIAYAVNKSAMKVGVRNLNDVSVWNSDKPLDYFTMSTRHIGLQMNAEHELEFAEVTEMTQMISALAENWYAGEIVKQIYADIGAVVEESLASIKIKIDTNDREGLRIQFGKALIESFDKKEDTIGLAQAFLNKARAALKNNERPNIPFSAATINGAFIADVASRLTKKGIRRKYTGIAAVLSPAYSMMSYFRFDDTSDQSIKTTTAENMPRIIRGELEKIGLTNFNKTSIWELCNSALVKDDNYDPILDNKVLNPFISKINRKYDIKQGDTIVIAKPKLDSAGNLQYDENNNVVVEYTTKLVESWDDYNRYVNDGDSNVIGKLTYAARELQGGDITFDFNGESFSVFNLGSVIALHALNRKVSDPTLAAAIVADEHWAEQRILDENGNVLLKESLQNIIQKQLEDLESGKLYDSKFGNQIVDVTNVNTVAAECIMGKSFAEQFGLIEGDDISDILHQGPMFFYNRFIGKYGMPDVPTDLANAVVYTKNGPLIVKFGNILNPEKHNLTKNLRIRELDGDLMLNDEVLCTADGVEVYSYAKDGEQYNILCVNNKKAFEELLDSELTETHRFVITQNNLREYLDFTGDTRANVLLGAQQAGTMTAESVVNSVKQSLNDDFENNLMRLSKQRFYAFRASLNIVGARIPTQAMQSFMPMKVIGFTNSTTNDIYVPRQQLWLQGSDLDIDKVYCLQYSILSNGTLATMSRLSRDFDPVEVLKLGKPNGVHYEARRDGEFIVSYEDLMRVVTPAELGQEKGQLDVFLKIIESGKKTIQFEAPADLTIEVKDKAGNITNVVNYKRAAEFKEAREMFIKYLNRHSESNIRLNKEAALRNMVVSGILTATLKPSVQGIAGMPIDMSEAQEAAGNSVLNDLEKHFSPDIPSSKWKLQVQALGAKDVVGISAVSVKCFFAETTYVNIMMERFGDLLISGNTAEAMDLLSRLLIKNPITGKAALISNVNLQKVIQRLKEHNIETLPIGLNSNLTENSWGTYDNFNIIKCLNDLRVRASAVDTALSESGILSSATDNMKELILPKLNATSEFVDIYTSLLSIGIPFDTVADIMTSPMFTEMSRLTQTNLLDGTTTGYRLKVALEFFLNRKPLPRIKRAMLQDLFERVGWVYEKDQKGNINKDKEFDVTKDINVVKKALDYAYKQRANSVQRSSKNDYYGDDEDIFLEEYFNEEYVGSSKVKIKDADLEDLNKIINYLEECLNRENLFSKLRDLSKTERYARFGTVEDQLNNLQLILDEVLPRTEEQQIFGRMLGINQGLRTDPHSMYSMIRSIENFINTRFMKNGINKVFVLNEFLKDSTYREDMCNEYDRCKLNVNILRAIDTVPHFKAMFNVLYMNEYIQSTLSSKHQMVNEIARTLENQSPYYSEEPYQRILNDKEYTQVERFVNDWYITGWLAQQNIAVKFPTLSSVYNGLLEKNRDTLTKPDTKLINTLYNFASFKHLMETSIIPDLQRDPRFASNSFIRSLEYGISKNRTTKKLDKYYRLPLNMMTIDDSTRTIALYESYLGDFDKISNVYLQKYGQTIGDLFFLYNLIVNKDSFGRSSFTRLFENLVAAKRGSPLINSFYDYIASVDNLDDRTNMIKELITSDKLEDLKARIHQNVATSNISASNEVENNLASSSSDFTFDMPNATKNWISFIDSIYPIQNNSAWGKLKLEKSVLKEEILNKLRSTYGSDNIVILTNSEWDRTFNDDEVAKSAPALITDGKVYIRRTEAASSNTVAHEFAHVILAGLRFDPRFRDFYYNIIGQIDVTKAKKVFGDEISEYQKSRVGIDLKEEIFAKYLEQWLSGKIDTVSSIGAFLLNNTAQIQDTINMVFGTNIQNIEQLVSFANMPLNDAIDAFGSSLFSVDFHSIVSPDYLVKAQALASLKHFLKSNIDPYQKLIEDCK